MSLEKRANGKIERKRRREDRKWWERKRNRERKKERRRKKERGKMNGNVRTFYFAVEDK